jgi:hypothetical protein
MVKNDIELLAMLMKDFEPITKETGNYVLTQVQQIIYDKVYDVYDPVVYERHEMDGGFVGSWIEETRKNGLNEIDSTIFSDPYLMLLDEENYIHGSPHWGDRRAEMSQNLRYGMHYDWGFNMRRDFWEPIEQFVQDGSEIDTAFEVGMSKRGIRFIKI